MRSILPLLTLLVGFAAGWLCAPAGKTTEGARSGVVGEGGPGAARIPRSGRSPSTGQAPADPSALLAAAFSEGTANYAAVRDLMAALALLTPENAGQFAEFFRNQSLAEGQIVLWRFFFSAWGELDPKAALAFIDERFEQAGARRVFYAAVLERWGDDSTEEALEFAMESFIAPESHEQAGLAFEYLRELSRDHPEEALKLAAQLTSEELLFDLTARRVSQLGKVSLQSALDAIEQLDGELHNHAVAQYVADWAREAPAAAAAWLAGEYDPSMGTYPLLEVAKAFVQTDANAALQWIGGLSPEQPRGTILGEAVLAWVKTDPVAAGEWLRTLETNPLYDAAIVAVGNQLAVTDPQAAIEEWVPRIFDPVQRNAFLYEVTGTWQRENLAGFSEWIERTTAISDQARQRLLAREAPITIPPGPDAPEAGPPPQVDEGR